MLKGNERANKDISMWQVIMLFLCVYVLLALFVDTVFTLPHETSVLLNRIDTLICFIFIGDFIYQLVTTNKKLAYLKYGWIDLISSIPYIHILRWGRFARIIRILRVLRGVRSVKLLFHFLFKKKSQGTFASVALFSLVMMIFSSIAILNCETSPESNIKTAGDALWWSFVTITTVGYGDYYPTTIEGRIIAVLLMTTGVGLFGTFTAYVASFFFQSAPTAQPGGEDEILSELRTLREKIEKMERKQK
jgi:voltage-gated potassium channel